MIRAQFRIRLPERMWVSEVSRSFPDATFTLLTGREEGERAIELGEIVTDKPDECVEALRGHPSITRFTVLESTGDSVLGKYETTDVDLYEFAGTSSLPVEFPVVVRDGWFDFDLTGTREDLDQLRTALEASESAYELQSVVGTADPDTLLTDRQREVLEAAVRAGYFEVPRTCTLADLAEAVDVEAATASTVLRRAEATLVKWFLSDPETKGRRRP